MSEFQPKAPEFNLVIKPKGPGKSRTMTIGAAWKGEVGGREVINITSALYPNHFITLYPNDGPSKEGVSDLEFPLPGE